MGISPFQVVVMQTAPHPIEQRGGLSNFGQIEVEARDKFSSKFQVQGSTITEINTWQSWNLEL
jgi:hypothetical protein